MKLLLIYSKFQIRFYSIQYMQISVILSDYDGTLSPTTMNVIIIKDIIYLLD